MSSLKSWRIALVQEDAPHGGSAGENWRVALVPADHEVVVALACSKGI